MPLKLSSTARIGRVEAAMLYDTLVPVVRRVGGRVASQVVTGSGAATSTATQTIRSARRLRLEYNDAISRSR